MKVAFTSVFLNPSTTWATAVSSWSKEFYYFKKLFESIGYEVHFVGNKRKNGKDLDYYVHYKDVNFNDYNLVLFFGSNPIFFGGAMKPHTSEIVKLMAEYNGPVIQMLSDPKVLMGNPAKALYKRFKICGDFIEKWNDINKRSHYLFPGKDISKYTRGWTPENVYQYDWFKYILSDILNLRFQPIIERKHVKKYDVVYYGNSNRGAFREKQLRHYFPTDTNNLLIGYTSKHITATQVSKVPHSQLLLKLDECKVSIIVGDEEHLDNVITFRLYETLASDCLAAIQIEYDPNREIIQDEVLRDLLYVTNSEDVKKLVNAFSEELLERQKKELCRLLKDKKTLLQEFKSAIDSMSI